MAAPLAFLMRRRPTCQMPLFPFLPWRPLRVTYSFLLPSFLTVSRASSCLCIFPSILFYCSSYRSKPVLPYLEGLWLLPPASLLSTSQVKEGFLARAQVLEPFSPGCGVWIQEKP